MRAGRPAALGLNMGKHVPVDIVTGKRDFGVGRAEISFIFSMIDQRAHGNFLSSVGADIKQAIKNLPREGSRADRPLKVQEDDLRGIVLLQYVHGRSPCK